MAEGGDARDGVSGTATQRDSPTTNTPDSPPEANTVRSPIPRFDLLNNTGGGDDDGKEGMVLPTTAKADMEALVEPTDSVLELDSAADSVSLHLPHSATFNDTQSCASGYPYSRPQSLNETDLAKMILQSPLPGADSDYEWPQRFFEEHSAKQSTPFIRNLLGPDFQKLSLPRGALKPAESNDVQVFDMRMSQHHPVKSQVLRGNFPHNADELKCAVAQKYNVPKECALVWSQEDQISGNKCVIVIDKEQESVLKLLFSEPYVDQADCLFTPRPEYCICVESSVTPEALQHKIASSFRDLGNFCFMLNKTLLQHGTLAEHRIKDVDLLEIVRIKPMTSKIMHRASTFIQHWYIVDVLNVDAVEELQRKFMQRFSSYFPSVASGLDVLFFTRGTTLLKAEEYPFMASGTLTDDSSLDSFDPDEMSQLIVHAKPASAVKAKLSFRLEGAKKIQKEAVLLPPYASPAQVRGEASRFCHKPANSLKILVQGKKIREFDQISQCPEFGVDCSIVVESQAKVEIEVLVQYLPGDGESQRLSISSYKHDVVGRVRAELARLLQVDLFHLCLKIQGGAPLEDFRTVRECRLRQGDMVTALVYRKRAILRVRKPAQVNDVLLVDDTSCTTVQQIAEFTQHRHGLKDGKVYLLCDGRRLPSSDTLEKAGVQSGSTLLVCCEEHPLPDNLEFLFEIFTQDCIYRKIQIISPSGERFALDVPRGSDPSRLASAFAPAGRATNSTPPSVPGVWVLSQENLSKAGSESSLRTAPPTKSGSQMDLRKSGLPSGSSAGALSSGAANTQGGQEIPVLVMPPLPSTSTPNPRTNNTSNRDGGAGSPFNWSKSVSIQSSEVSSTSPCSGLGASSSMNTSGQTSLEVAQQAPNTCSDYPRSRSQSFTMSDLSRTTGRSRHTTEKHALPSSSQEKVLSCQVWKQEWIQRDQQQLVRSTRIQEQPLVPARQGEQGEIDRGPTRSVSMMATVPHHEVHPGLPHSFTTDSFGELPGVVEDRILLVVAHQLGLEWETFALSLGLSQNNLDQIKTHYSGNLSMQAMRALHCWKQTNGREATPAALKTKLLDNNLRLIAERIDYYEASKYQTA